jgi:EmrB/QacA subfamily drug resistance transporter
VDAPASPPVSSHVSPPAAPLASATASASDGATALAIRVTPAPRRASARTVALIVASAMFMEQLDGTVLATALPTMARSFHVDPLRMSVALTAYLLSLAVFIPASGKAADRFGSRTVFRAAIVLFTLGSVLCAQAPTLPFLVGARIIQGLGGAMMVPVGRLVLLRSVSKAELVTAMTWLMIPATIGPILGPPLGGFIVTWLDWRWIFYINLPVGALGLVLVSRYIEEVTAPGKVRFDLIGLLLSGVCLSTLMFGIELGTRGVGSRGLAALLIAIGMVSGALYLRHARDHPQPVLDMRLMRIPTFRISVLAGTLSRIAVGAMPFLLPMMLQLGFGMSAAQSGLITFSSAAGSMLMRATAPGFLRRLGFRRVLVWVGLLSAALFLTTAAFRPDWPRPLIYGVLLCGGFVQSLVFMAYNTIAYADVPPPRMSAATSFYTTFQQMTLTLGIAVAAASLAASVALTGHPVPGLGDYSAAFLVVGAIAAMAPLVSLRLDHAAGAELSGQREPRSRS